MDGASERDTLFDDASNKALPFAVVKTADGAAAGGRTTSPSFVGAVLLELLVAAARFFELFLELLPAIAIQLEERPLEVKIYHIFCPGCQTSF